jgi:hypothetical protein
MQQHEGVEDSFIDDRRGYLIQRIIFFFIIFPTLDNINDVRLVCTARHQEVILDPNWNPATVVETNYVETVVEPTTVCEICVETESNCHQKLGISGSSRFLFLQSARRIITLVAAPYSRIPVQTD